MFLDVLDSAELQPRRTRGYLGRQSGANVFARRQFDVLRDLIIELTFNDILSKQSA